ncbi:hypothetical protein [Paenibacillus massiliensis]|uniref:hypothetical protein n=1 Tax=Paenibacillus massiliensis TaxID=225917 RepID=UPI00046F94F1|nr:hypothetical protein [Paenibacillus massiliensis]
MINLKPQVRDALELIGVPVSPEYPDDVPELPSITFYEAGNQDARSVDDVASSALIEFYIHVWGTGVEQIEPIAQDVDKQMKAMDFWRTFGADDLTQPVKRKILRYTIMKEA